MTLQTAKTVFHEKYKQIVMMGVVALGLFIGLGAFQTNLDNRNRAFNAGDSISENTQALNETSETGPFINPLYLILALCGAGLVGLIVLMIWMLIKQAEDRKITVDPIYRPPTPQNTSNPRPIP